MTPRPCFWRNALAVSAIGSLVGASPAFAANVTTTTTPSPIVSSTTAVSSTTGVPTPKVILGGGRLLREFSGDALMIDDNYVVVVASPTEHMASIYVESTLKCTGAHSSFRAFFEGNCSGGSTTVRAGSGWMGGCRIVRALSILSGWL